MRLPLWLSLLGVFSAPASVAGADATQAPLGPRSVPTQPTGVRFVGVEEAARLLASDAVILDARASGFLLAHVPTARSVDWLDYRDGWGRTGRLHPDPQAMADRLARLGVDPSRPVLVYGAAAAGFGEEGRIAWLLLYLGHPQVALLDGGFAAWRAAGRSVERGPALRSPRPGRFPAQPQPGLRADRGAVLRALADATGTAPILLDVRSEAEWHGATPYLEARGGHIPGARWFEWLRLLDARGQLKPDEALSHELTQRGLADRSREIIVYCTGGVRSAFVVAVLRRLGYTQVRNYDGSFWEWAADRTLPVEKSASR